MSEPEYTPIPSGRGVPIPSGPAIAMVPNDRIPELQARLAKLNGKADKLGSPGISLILGTPVQTKISEHEYGVSVPVWVMGEAPKLNGWQFVATLEHDESGAIIRRMPTFYDEEIDLSAHRGATPDNCDHCHYKRRRNDTYIVWNVGHYESDNETPVTKQVGSSCLKDFTGHENPAAVAKLMEQVRDYIEDVRGGMFEGGHLVPRYELTAVLDVAAATVRQEGRYVSRKEAWDEGLQATGDTLRVNWRKYMDGLFIDVMPPDRSAAEQALEWVRNLSEDDLTNDYLWNLYTVCKNDTITERQFGIAASVLTAYVFSETKRIKDAGGEFLGEEGKQLEVTATVDFVYENEDQGHGVQYKNILKDSKGRKLSWLTGLGSLEVGQTYHGTFTVKKHFEGRNGKETQIFKPATLNEDAPKGTLERYVETV